MDSFVLSFENYINSGIGAVYIENIMLEEEDSALFVDNFNDDISGNALNSSTWTWKGGTGSAITIGCDTIAPYGGYGKSFSFTYNAPSDGWCAVSMGLNHVNVSSKDTLSFYVKGSAGSEKPNIYLRDIVTRGYVDIEDYVTLTLDWQRVNIPLSDFKDNKPSLDLSDLVEMQTIFEGEAVSGTIYLDDIAFVKYSMSIAPTLDTTAEITNSTVITLEGTKAPGTSVWINGVEVVTPNNQTTWSANHILSEGPNNIAVMTKDGYGASSDIVTRSIGLDTQLPTAVITAPSTAEVNEVITFDGSDSSDNYGIASYAWNFGDSSQSSGKIVTHAYTEVGTYNVTLTVYDIAGNGPVSDALPVAVSSGSPTYTLNTTALNGSVAVSPDKPQYNHGETVTLTAEPDTGYHFTHWSGDVPSGHETDNPLILTMDFNKSITANFDINTYTITASVGPGGTITPSGAVTVTHGSSQTFTITPDAGYYVADVVVDGSSVGSVESYTFDNVIADHTITIDFTIFTYTLTTSALYGSITVSPDKPYYNHGENITLTPDPDRGYSFLDWQGDAPIVHEFDDPLYLYMDSDKYIIGRFGYDPTLQLYKSDSFTLVRPKMPVSGGMSEPSDNYSLDNVEIGNPFGGDRSTSENYSIWIFKK